MAITSKSYLSLYFISLSFENSVEPVEVAKQRRKIEVNNLRKMQEYCEHQRLRHQLQCVLLGGAAPRLLLLILNQNKYAHESGHTHKKNEMEVYTSPVNRGW